MEFNAFSHQSKFLRSEARIRGAFAGKRCIRPETIVPCLDGLKAFGDILSKDLVLSFDHKAKQFRYSQSGDAFPKTRSTGYRVIHERGEFVASPAHRISLISGEYLSVEEIARRFRSDGDAQALALLSHPQTIAVPGQLSSHANDPHWSQTHEDFWDHCAAYIRQCGRRLLLGADSALNEFLQTRGALGFCPSFALQCQPHARLDGLLDMRSKHSRLDQGCVLQSILGVRDRACGQRALEQGAHLDGDIFLQSQGCTPKYERQRSCFGADHKGEPFSQSASCHTDAFPSTTNILAIEQVQSQWWWDIEVPGCNNYFAGGVLHHNSGKSEVGAIESIIHLETKRGYTPSQVDPYIGVVIAPTTDMLRRLSLAKILGYSKPFKPSFHKTHHEITWPNGSVLYGISADKPERLEGIKANFIFIDEALQVKEQIFLESLARVADTKGRVWCTGSLGIQYTNPKTHWAYKHFIQKPLKDSEVFAWTTAENPYFPKEELERLKDTLDPKTYRQMFEISWEVQASNLVYDEFNEQNYVGHTYDPRLETYVSIDWGYAAPAAIMFLQYSPFNDTVYVFDEIVKNKMTLEQMWDQIQSRPYRINGWICDIAGTQEREMTGLSNVQWFKQKNVHFKYRASSIAHGVSLMRSYILNMKGQRRFYVNDKACPHTIDSMKNYSYKVKDGMLLEEIDKQHSHVPDALRYFFLNHLDYTRDKNSFQEFNRWTLGAL